MAIFDFVFILLRINLWQSAEKRLSSWLSARAVLLDAVSVVCVPFLLSVWGWMWNSIVSVPDQCLFTHLECGKCPQSSVLMFAKLADNQKRHYYAETNNYTRHSL